MTNNDYNIMKQRHDISVAKQHKEATDRANKAYNKGLWESLTPFKLYLYPLLSRHN